MKKLVKYILFLFIIIFFANAKSLIATVENQREQKVYENPNPQTPSNVKHKENKLNSNNERYIINEIKVLRTRLGDYFKLFSTSYTVIGLLIGILTLIITVFCIIFGIIGYRSIIEVKKELKKLITTRNKIVKECEELFTKNKILDFLVRGNYHLLSENYEAAMASYREVQELEPSSAESYIGVGKCLNML